MEMNRQAAALHCSKHAFPLPCAGRTCHGLPITGGNTDRSPSSHPGQLTSLEPQPLCPTSRGSPNPAALSPHPSQVSLAVLLENFLEASNELEAREERERIVRAEREQQVKNPLEPLLLKLTKEFSDDQDLSDRLQRLYEVASVSSYFCSLLSVAAYSSRAEATQSLFSANT